MLDWDTKLDFEPSRTTKKLWLFVRKAPRIIGGVTLPGLFQITHFSVDTSFFMTVVGLEIWGLTNLLIVSEVSLSYLVLPFLIDLALAFFRHLPQGSICEMENERIVTREPATLDILNSKIKRKRMVAAVLAAAILLAGFFKAVIFWTAQNEAFDALTAGILLSYLLAALIHVKCTGYFLFGIITSVSLWMDRRRYQRGKEAGNREDPAVTVGDHRHSHELHPSGFLVEATAREQRLAKISGKDAYWFETWGLLRDEELESLASSQHTEEQSAFVAREGLRHQILILRVGPQAKPRGEEQEQETHREQRHDNVVEMKLRSRLVWATVFFGVLILPSLSGCVKAPRASVRDISIPVTVLIDQPVAGSKGLTPEAVQLLSPVWGEECKSLFYPDITFVRLDQDPAEPIHWAKIEPEEVAADVQEHGSKLRRFFKFKPSAEQKINYVRDLLSRRKPEPALASPAVMRSMESAQAALVGSIREGNDLIILVNREGGEQGDEVASTWQSRVPNSKVIRARDEQEVSQLIAEQACKAAASRGAESSVSQEYLVVYLPTAPKNLPGSTKNSPAQAEEGTAGNHNHAGAVPEPAAGPSADELISAIRSRLRNASKDELKAIESEMVRAELTYGLDYRFPYEHAKLVVFGRAEHHEAFNLLSNAGQRALKAGDGPEMLALLRQDGQEGGPLHKLAHGHHEWSNLLDALADGDSERLAQGGSLSHHHSGH